MKIRKLHIKNYKVFNDLELDFTDAQGNTLDKIVLAGVNGCGKTTVLELIKNIYDGSLSDYLKKFKECSINIEVELSNLERDYHQNVIAHMRKNEGLIETSLNDAQIIISAHIQENSLFVGFFSDGISQLLYLPVDNIKSTISKRMNAKIINLSSSKKEMKTMAIKSVKDEIFKNKDMTPRQSIEKGINEISGTLKGMNLTTKLVDLESEELIFESVNGERIKFEDLSNGEKTLYFRAIYLSKLVPKNSIIMIDEPEDSLHPTWQQKVLQLYQNIGENNQVIVATHSPHIIGSSKAEEVFLLEIDENKIGASHPKYTKGHSIDYILEVMGANPRDTAVINIVDEYLALMRKGQHETDKGLKLKAAIDALELDPNSEEMRRLDLSIKRIKAVGV
jgi:predicted ATP-binding protein involved in virulence